MFILSANSTKQNTYLEIEIPFIFEMIEWDNQKLIYFLICILLKILTYDLHTFQSS